MQSVNNLVIFNLKIKGVIGIVGIVWVTIFSFLGRDNFANVFDEGFAFGNISCGKYPFTVNTRLFDLNLSS